MIARYREGRLARSPGPGAFDAAALREAVVEHFDRYDITGALDSIWQAVRALNQHVEATAPWNLAKDEARSTELDTVLYDLADGIVGRRRRARAVPSRDRSADPGGASSAGRPVARPGRARGGRGGRGDRARCAALPARRRAGPGCVIDTHAHLDALDDPDAAVSRALEAGVSRILTVGTTVAGCRTALDLADRHEGVYAMLGLHPHEAGAVAVGDVDRLDGASGSPARGGRRRDRARLLPRLRAAGRPAEALSAPARCRRRHRGSRWSSTLGRPTRTRSSNSTASQARSCSTASRPPICSRRRSTAGTTSRSRGTSPTRRRPTCARRPHGSRPTGSWPRQTRRTWRRSPSAAGRTSPRTWFTPLRRWPRRAAQEPAALEAAIEENAAAAFQPAVRDEAEYRGDSEADSPGARRSRDAGSVSITPRKQLGQHFLVDQNILGVVGRLASSARTTSCWRSARGWGCSRATWRRVLRSSTRSRSTDPSFRTCRSFRTSGSRSVTRSGSTSPSLDPPPGKLVANLPYNIATPIVVESLDGLLVGRELVRDGPARGR